MNAEVTSIWVLILELLFVPILALILGVLNNYRIRNDKTQKDSLDSLMQIEIQNGKIEYMADKVEKIIKNHKRREEKKNLESLEQKKSRENKEELDKLSKLL